MENASELAKAFHERLEQASATLGIVKSRLNGRVSSHIFNDKTSFSSIVAFQKVATSEKCGEQSLIGTISGELCLSVNAAYKTTAPTSHNSKKRRFDSELEEAERAVSKVKKSGEGSEKVTENSYEIATQMVSNLLKLKGAVGEPCIEAWAVSLRKQGEWGAAPSPDGRPSLLVAARLTGGLAIKLSPLLHAFKHCRDGMVTISSESINKDFNLPKTEQCLEADCQGQRSMLFLASVPNL